MAGNEQGVRDFGRHLVVPRTLIFVEREGLLEREVLLLQGAPTKRLWAGRFNGLGGHVERTEDVFSSARRELLEEAGLVVDDLTLRAVVHVDTGLDLPGVLLFVFSAAYAGGEPKAGAEGTLHWVARSRVLQRDLVDDLRVLLPRLWECEGQKQVLSARFATGPGGAQQIDWGDGQD